MRLLRLALVAWALIGASNAAHAQGMIVSEFDCRPAMTCDSYDPAFPAQAVLLSNAKACISRFMPTNQGMSPFDDTTGLDQNNCLSTNPQAFPIKGKVATIPQCCVTKIQTGGCILHCSIFAQ